MLAAVGVGLLILTGCASPGSATASDASGSSVASQPAPESATTTSSGAGGTGTTDTGAAALQLTRIAEVAQPSQAYSLAYDPVRDALWYVTRSESASSVLLNESSAATGSLLKQFTLASADAASLGTTVAAAPDGSVWLTENYGLIRVDPATGAIRRVDLPMDVAGALPGATNPNAPVAGSSVTSLTFTATSALVGRTNVPFLQQFSLDLTQLDDVALPSGDAGPVAMTIDGSQLFTAYRVQGSSGPTIDQVPMPLPKGLAAPTDQGGTPLDPSLLAARPDGNNADLLAPSGRTVLDTGIFSLAATWQPSSGTTLTVPLPTMTGQVNNPQGQLVDTHYRAQVAAAVQTPDGNLWIVQGGGSTWYLDGYTTHG